MSKRALGILAAVEGLVILGMAGFLVGGGRAWMLAGRMATRGFAPFHHGIMGGWGHGFGGFGFHLLVWLIPVALIALIVGLVLRPKPPEEPKS